MNEVLTLLRPRLIAFLGHKRAAKERGRMMKAFLFGTVGGGFWVGIFLVFFRVLSYFQNVEGFGDILAEKLLSMVLVTFFSLLVFSGILTCLSKLYLSRDLALVHSFPVSHAKVFLARWVESTIDSSWMVLVYALPVFFSYGVVYQQGPFFYANVAMVLVPFCVVASGISVLLVMTAVVLLPASRIRSIFVSLGLLCFVALYVALRLLRPERLVDPDAFSSVVVYLQSLSTPSSPWLPSTWAFDSMRAALKGHHHSALFHNALAASGGASMVFIVTWLAGLVYFPGLSKAQTARVRMTSRGAADKRSGAKRPFGSFSGPVRAFLVKEIKTFFRDQTQWPQILLIAALIAIYLYNFKVLPLEKAPIKTVYLQNLFSFLNMGLAAFVLTAVAARFVFPAVSMEKEAVWIVLAAPVSVGTVLWIKFAIYLIPLLVLSEILVVATNFLLSVTPFMMWLSVTTVFCMVPGVIAMGIGLGAAYPDFQSENPAQSVTSFGGMLFMILCAGFIGGVIIIEAGPVYAVFMAGIRGQDLSAWEWMWLVGSFSLALVLCALAVILPMRFGTRHMLQR